MSGSRVVLSETEEQAIAAALERRDIEQDPSLFLDHIRAGIERLEDCSLSDVEAVEATRLAWRLAKAGRRA